MKQDQKNVIMGLWVPREKYLAVKAAVGPGKKWETLAAFLREAFDAKYELEGLEIFAGVMKTAEEQQEPYEF